MYDVSQRYRSNLAELEKRIEQLKLSNPADYYRLPEYDDIMENIRICNRQIRNYERMLKHGVKF